ncbi:hypothetical protein ACFFJX_09770 [Pseudarcicella hirudinis]|uniref:hypothetical protein n=1 Tax=Pseudarcicella hirudinis TaxID=1079859 RepID=UPI0035E5D05A
MLRPTAKEWEVLVDKSTNKTDIPHDYVELNKPVQTRFLKLEKHSRSNRKICDQ